MSPKTPTLHLLCGKIASGKSTLAANLAQQESAVIIAEDAWLSALYAEQMSSIPDFLHYAKKLRAVMGPHVAALLNKGQSVVLDFQANTIESRSWMQGILAQTKAAHMLHVLDVSDEICIKRLHARNATGDHPFAATEAQFLQLSKHFHLPEPAEGFETVIHKTRRD